MSKIYIATSNPGKLRELKEAAQSMGVDVESLPGFGAIAPAVEDGATFEENARIKALYYSRFFPGKLVLAEDSGLSVDELQGAPGVYSARYAATLAQRGQDPSLHENSDDQENNRALIAQLERLPNKNHAGKYVCLIVLAREGEVLATFQGEAHGELITTPRGAGGFGYDPLFYFPSLGKTFAELGLEEKRGYSHRGQAFRRFLDWYLKSDLHDPLALARKSK
jgi:XTP/dITP diphosphohydrolase